MMELVKMDPSPQENSHVMHDAVFRGKQLLSLALKGVGAASKNIPASNATCSSTRNQQNIQMKK